MKKVYEMLTNTPRVIIQRTTEDGFSGVINMMKWTGTIIVSWGGGWEHVSVSPYKRHIIPSWDDMCYIKNLFWEEDECVVEYHPAKSEYVNNMPNCLHLWKPAHGKFPVPPSILTGVRPGQSKESIRQELEDLYPIQKATKQIRGIKYPQQDIATELENLQLTRQEAAAYGWNEAMKIVEKILEIYGEDEI